MIDEKARETGREAIARMKDADDAPYSAALIRAGKWDDVSEVAMAIAGARLAYESAKQKGEAVAWAEEYGGRIVSVALEQGSFHKTPLYRAMLSAGGKG